MVARVCSGYTFEWQRLRPCISPDPFRTLLSDQSSEMFNSEDRLGQHNDTFEGAKVFFLAN